jgi:hypothetical protein
MKSKVIASTFLLGALLLTGCGAEAIPESAPAPSPSATPTKKSAPEWKMSAIAETKPGTGFDLQNTVFFEGFTEIVAVLDQGVLLTKGDATGSTFVKFDGTVGWSIPDGGSRIIWDGKEYLVSIGSATTTGSNQSLDVEADKTVSTIRVYDTETGKVVKEHSAPVAAAPTENDWVRPRIWHQNIIGPKSQRLDSQYQNGLLFFREKGNKDIGYKTVNPITGETIKEYTVPENPKRAVRLIGITAAGDFVVRDASKVAQDSITILPGVAELPGLDSATFDGKYLHGELPGPNGTTRLGVIYDGATGKALTDPKVGSTALNGTSPNGRYLYGGTEVLDTQTMKRWASGENGQRSVGVATVDDKGTAYTVVPEATGRELASDVFGYEMNIADGSSSPIGSAPAGISRSQFAVYKPDSGEVFDDIYAVPLKK